MKIKAIPKTPQELQNELITILNLAPPEVQQLANRWYIDDDDNSTVCLQDVIMQKHMPLHEIKNVAKTIQTAFNVYYEKSASLFNRLHGIVEYEAA